MVTRGANAAACGLLAVGVALTATWLLAQDAHRLTDLVWLVATLAFLVVGAFVVARRPGNLVGWVFAVAGLAFLLNGAAAALTTVWLARPHDVPVVGPAAGWLRAWLFIPALGLMGFAVPMLFPDGRLPSRRWRPVAAAAAAYVTLASVGGALRPGTYELDGDVYANPLGVAWLSWLPEPNALALGFPVLLVLGAVAIAQRYRHGGEVERQQLKWFLAAVALVAAAFPVPVVVEIVIGVPLDESYAVVPLSVSLIPVSAGIAILRYRLYEIDRVISRTVSYGLLTGLLAVYLLAVMGLQQGLRPVMGESQLAVAGATLIVAALFQPARRRIQGAWIVASTGRATTASAPWRRSGPGCATGSTSTS